MEEQRKPTESPVSRCVGNCCGLFKGNIPEFLWRNRGNLLNRQSVYRVSWLRLEPRSFRMWWNKAKLGETQIGLILRNPDLFLCAWVRVSVCFCARVYACELVYGCTVVCILACVHTSVSICVLCVRAKMIYVSAITLEEQLLIN